MDYIDVAIAAMQTEIEKHGLELMQRYPNDLIVHDRAMLEHALKPGAKIAWMCGHSHTHLVQLGIHPDENEMVGYLTNMAADDRFYVIDVKSGEFTMRSITREDFAALAATPTPYRATGDKLSFWLSRKLERIGHIAIEVSGTIQERRHNVTITPIEGISALDHAALRLWASKAQVKAAGTLFCRGDITFGPAAVSGKVA